MCQCNHRGTHQMCQYGSPPVDEHEVVGAAAAEHVAVLPLPLPGLQLQEPALPLGLRLVRLKVQLPQRQFPAARLGSECEQVLRLFEATAFAGAKVMC